MTVLKVLSRHAIKNWNEATHALLHETKIWERAAPFSLFQFSVVRRGFSQTNPYVKGV